MMAKKKETTAPDEELNQEQEEVHAAGDADPAEVEQAPPTPQEEGLPPRDERRIAALAHGGILLNLITGIGGPVLALILWLYNEHKSEYVGWHALQALVFQGISMLLTLVLGGIAVAMWFVMIPLLNPSVAYVGFCLVPFTLGFTLIAAAVVIGSLIYGCAGALAVMEGQDFRYRWIANLIPPLTKP
jgi:uncharacterized Tic20 family protein